MPWRRMLVAAPSYTDLPFQHGLGLHSNCNVAKPARARVPWCVRGGTKVTGET
jgi:hypothetical protein